MSRASRTFDEGIKDADTLLAHFDELPQEKHFTSEVLKRAGLVMALTAWETYVEDFVEEELERGLRYAKGFQGGSEKVAKLKGHLKQFHNPGSAKTKQLFEEYLGIDVTETWRWSNYDPESARTKLNKLLTMRGEIVHRSFTSDKGAPSPHLVSRDSLEKGIRFLKELVEATEKAFSDE